MINYEIWKEGKLDGFSEASNPIQAAMFHWQDCQVNSDKPVTGYYNVIDTKTLDDFDVALSTIFDCVCYVNNQCEPEESWELDECYELETGVLST